MGQFVPKSVEVNRKFQRFCKLKKEIRLTAASGKRKFIAKREDETVN